MVGASGLTFAPMLGWLWVPVQQLHHREYWSMVFWQKALRKMILHCSCCAQRAVLEEQELCSFGLTWFSQRSNQEMASDSAGFGAEVFLHANAFVQVSIPLLFSDLPSNWGRGLLREKVKEVRASREGVVYFRISGISVGWAAKARGRETLDPKMPSYTPAMRHRAQIAGVCPGSFFNRLLCHRGALKWHKNRLG